MHACGKLRHLRDEAPEVVVGGGVEVEAEQQLRGERGRGAQEGFGGVVRTERQVQPDGTRPRVE